MKDKKAEPPATMEAEAEAIIERAAQASEDAHHSKVREYPAEAEATKELEPTPVTLTNESSGTAPGGGGNVPGQDPGKPYREPIARRLGPQTP